MDDITDTTDTSDNTEAIKGRRKFLKLFGVSSAGR